MKKYSIVRAIEKEREDGFCEFIYTDVIIVNSRFPAGADSLSFPRVWTVNRGARQAAHNWVANARL